MSLSQELQNLMYDLSDFSDLRVRDRANRVGHLLTVVSQREISSFTSQYQEAERALGSARNACAKARKELDEIADMIEKVDKVISAIERLVP